MADQAGEVVVGVRVDLTGADKGLDSLVARSRNADRNVSEATRGIASSMQLVNAATAAVDTKFAETTGRLGTFGVALNALKLPIAAVAGIAGIGALAIAADHAIKEFANLEKQMLTIQAVLNATASASGKTANEINALAESIAHSSLATSTELRSAATQLASFRNISGETFDRTLKAAADLAANGFGSVESAAFSLGRALTNPTDGLTRLTRSGVLFTETQKLQIKQMTEQGKVAEAQSFILGILEKQVGGAGAAQSSGLSGAFHKLKEASGTFFENVGGWIAKAIGLQVGVEGLAGAVSKLTGKLDISPTATIAEKIVGKEKDILANDAAIVKLTADLERLKALPTSNVMSLLGNNSAQTKATEEALARAREKSIDLRQALAELKSVEAGEKIAAGMNAAAAAAEAASGKFKGVEFEFDELIKKLKMTEAGQKAYEAAAKAGVVGNNELTASLRRQIDTIEALQYARSRAGQLYSREALDQLKTSLLNEEQTLAQGYIQQQEQLKKFLEQKYITQQEYDEKVLQLRAANTYQVAQIQKKADDIEFDAKVKTLNAGVELLGVFAAKSKIAAVAGIALSKAIAIATIIHNTTAAAAAALAPPPIGAGPIAGAALAASIETWGAIQVALVAATGIAQAAGALGGGGVPSPTGGGGTGGGGLPATGATTPFEPGPPSTSLTIEGVDPAMMYSGDQLNKLIDRISDAVRNGVTLVSTRHIRV